MYISNVIAFVYFMFVLLTIYSFTWLPLKDNPIDCQYTSYIFGIPRGAKKSFFVVFICFDVKPKGD